MASYTEVYADDVRRLFLQAILSRGVVSEKLAKLLWRKSVDAVKTANGDVNATYHDSDRAWAEFVATVNNSLNDLDLELHALNDQSTGKPVYSLVNRKADDIALLATSYTALEIQFFRNLVQQIMLADNEVYSISSMAALREVNELKGTGSNSFTKSHGESVLGSFVAKGWLIKSERGRYSLSPRTLTELHAYLAETYPDEVLTCTICYEVVTSGTSCARPNCKFRCHKPCWAGLPNKNSCPTCSLAWNSETLDGLRSVGEQAFRDGDYERRRTRGGPSQEGQGSEEEDEEENEASPPASKAKDRKFRKKKDVQLSDSD